jgi:hypothetical protein
MGKGYRISNYRKYFTVNFDEKRIGGLFETVTEAEEFIKEHKKMREFNLKQIRDEKAGV